MAVRRSELGGPDGSDASVVCSPARRTRADLLSFRMKQVAGSEAER